jgi:CheY-like chemotaxis protein
MATAERPLPALVVDDDEPDRRLVAELLTEEGFSVTEARTGREAIDLLRKRRFSAMVLDILMPVIDGFDVMKFLRRDNPATLGRTVVVSRVDLRDLKAFFPSCRVLQKPPDRETLRGIVREIRTSEEGGGS